MRTLPSPFLFDGTVARLTSVIEQRGMTLFTVVDHAGGAREAGLEMNDAKVFVFGNPRGGTPVMVAAPLTALELPLWVLVWADQDGAVFVSHQDLTYFEDAYQVPASLVAPLSAALDSVVAAALTPESAS